MICPKCGNTNPDGSRFCDFCGAALTDPSATQDAIAALSEQEKAVKKKAGRKVVILVVVIVAVIAIAAAVFFMHGGFGGHGNEAEPAPEQTAEVAPEQAEQVTATETEQPAESAQTEQPTGTENEMVPTQTDYLGIWLCDSFKTGKEVWSGYNITFHPKGYMYFHYTDASKQQHGFTSGYSVDTKTGTIPLQDGKLLLSVDEEESNPAYQQYKVTYYPSDNSLPTNDFKPDSRYENQNGYAIMWEPFIFLLGSTVTVDYADSRIWYAQDDSGLIIKFGRNGLWDAYGGPNSDYIDSGAWVITQRPNDEVAFIELYPSSSNTSYLIGFPTKDADLIDDSGNLAADEMLQTHLTVGNDGKLQFDKSNWYILAPQPPVIDTKANTKTGDTV